MSNALPIPLGLLSVPEVWTFAASSVPDSEFNAQLYPARSGKIF